MGDITQHEISLRSSALDELNSPDARALLETINELRKLKVGEIVDLPQIIVVGDQSSGKSSVLEAISRVRFPTKGSVCTCFATELVMWRAPVTKIEVTINFFESGSSELFQRTSFDKDALPDIISEAAKKMGIYPESTRRFSRDILRVEIAGPDVDPVTLVDLPGFFHAETDRQSDEDSKIAKDIAKYYMRQSKSIILAVVSASNNLANQVVVKEAKKHDPRRERTIGLITKPDLTEPGSDDETEFIELVRGQQSMHKLKLGWYVLRNRRRHEQNTSADDRDAQEEQFFQNGAWSRLDPANCGVKNLRKKLREVLLEHIQKTLPGLIEDIERNLSSRQQDLDRYGKARETPDDLRAYLLDIAEKYHRLARDGVEGRYGEDFFGGLYDARETRKLRALLRNLNRAFYDTLEKKGVARKIEWEDTEGTDSDDDAESVEFDNDAEGVGSHGCRTPKYLKPFLRLFAGFPKPDVVSESHLCKELDTLAAANRGSEFLAYRTVNWPSNSSRCRRSHGRK